MRRLLRQAICGLAVTLVMPSLALASMCFNATEVFFPIDSIELSDSDLLRVILVIEKVQASSKLVAVIVDGHADPGEASNADLLSTARAGAVAYLVLQHHPELKAIIWIEGKGSKQPVSKDPEQNRRVEVTVTCVVPPPYFDY